MHEQLPPTLPGFETIKRFWDKNRQITITKILPGEYYVSINDEIISTVLGSCVAACIWDEKNKIGGMNHFLIPKKVDPTSPTDSYALRYGSWIMESLINELLKHGAERKHMRAKVFGGGKLNHPQNNHVRNIEFVLAHLMLENIPLVVENTGGAWPRKLMFSPLTGKAQMKKLQFTHNDTIERRERQYLLDVQTYEDDSNIELFK